MIVEIIAFIFIIIGVIFLFLSDFLSKNSSHSVHWWYGIMIALFWGALLLVLFLSS
jgi:hypothetical protein